MATTAATTKAVLFISSLFSPVSIEISTRFLTPVSDCLSATCYKIYQQFYICQIRTCLFFPSFLYISQWMEETRLFLQNKPIWFVFLFNFLLLSFFFFIIPLLSATQFLQWRRFSKKLNTIFPWTIWFTPARESPIQEKTLTSSREVDTSLLTWEPAFCCLCTYFQINVTHSRRLVIAWFQMLR